MSNSTMHNDPKGGTQQDGQKDADKHSRDQSQQGGDKQGTSKQGGGQSGSHGGSDKTERQGGRGA